MSELEEPPAKVLKIDNIDGVTHVTELSGFPEPFDGVGDQEMMGEESGIIEGGAEPEQEEWLSEGILTDDDYNPRSQETNDDRTDSQIGTGDEEHLDSTLDSEVLNETEPNLHETDANGTNPDEDLEHGVVNSADKTSAEATSESEANVSQNEDNVMDTEANVSLENGTQEENETELTVNEASLTHSDTNVNCQTNLSQSIEELMKMSNIESSVESQTYTQEYPMEVTPDTKVVRSTASDIIIQRVITLNKNSNSQEVEDTVKNLDSEKDDVERFLNKSTVVKSQKTSAEVEQEQDDGNDTDDLLRMLGEDGSKGKKKMTKTMKNTRAAAPAESSEDEDDDDDFVYEGSSATITKLKVAKSVLAKKQATKAEPEDMEDGDDETEMSADESVTVKRMFSYNAKSTAGKGVPPHAAGRRQGNILNIIDRPKDVKTSSRQYQNKRSIQSRAQSILKPTTQGVKHVPTAKSAYTTVAVKTSFKPPEVKAPVPFKSRVPSQTIEKKVEKKIEPSKTKTELGKINQGGKTAQQGRMKFEPGQMKVGSGKITIEPGRMRMESEEIIDEEEFLDDEEFRLDEDEFAESETEVSHQRQRIMRPEIMDEEVPSDGDSASEDGSLYDELPSSDSDDMDDWFSLDIRSEKAGDYIPLLGPKAKELLLEEKRRVSSRLSTLKQSHTALIASGKQQAATLRRATATLAELDDMLRAA